MKQQHDRSNHQSESQIPHPPGVVTKRQRDNAADSGTKVTDDDALLNRGRRSRPAAR